MAKRKQPGEAVNLGRHETHCKICAHPERDAIERDFVNWGSPPKIAKQYGLRHRNTVYRHAEACGLVEKRGQNIRAALGRIIERAGDVRVNAAAVVTAVATFARINSRGQLVERTERVDLNKLFERMTQDEMRRYAESGALPEWFPADAKAAAEVIAK